MSSGSNRSRPHRLSPAVGNDTIVHAWPDIPISSRLNISSLLTISLQNYAADRNDIYLPNISVKPKHKPCQFHNEPESAKK
jgi:hypothetical protein